jgi:predicted transcriptional regulator
MKTAISVPDDVFEQVEATAKHLGISRSEVFTRAVRRFVREARDEHITASYDEAFADDDDRGESFRRAASRKALIDIEWEP